jgi:type III secretion protein D
MSSPTPLPSAHELRVLAGDWRGARVEVNPGQRYRVGGDAGTEVRLHGSAASAEFVLEGDDVVWQALAGELRLGDTTLEPGDSRRVPLLTPVWVGGTPVAVGPLASTGWAALFDAPAAQAGPAAAAPSAAPATLPTRWPRRLALAGAALTAASLSMLALAVVIAPEPPTLAQRAQRAEALLRSAGLTAVTVSAEDGRIVIDGYLETDAERTRTEQLLAQQGLQPVMRAWVNETVVKAVHDVYRVHGVMAEVQGTGPGAVRVQTALADPSTLTSIERTVRRDVKGLSRLDALNQAPPHVPSPVPSLSDAGKRVASVVAGPEPYVVTADGTRYFIGALLPTGHRILAIDGSRVQLEREGQTTALVF